MLPYAYLGSRARIAAALVAAVACVATAIAGVAACLTAPPADVGASTDERPEIIHTAVYPPEGLIRQWPSENKFYVPVRLADPTATCVWRAVDQDLEAATATTLYSNIACAISLLDGGVIVQNVQIPQPTDGHCHILTFVVAQAFAGNVPTSIGGDTARWEYEPPAGLCNFYDAGTLQDGAFPPSDAGSDGLPVTPESGTSDAGGDP